MDFKTYMRFVDGVTSNPSKDLDSLIEHLVELKEAGEEPSRFMTAGIGLASESGELAEIVKKVIFQNKPLNDETKFHIKRELGDIMWYIAQMCIALDITLDEIIDENFDKLKNRYPGGFSVDNSENKEVDDL